MEFIEVIPSERELIKDLRTLKPNEAVSIIASNDGKTGQYLVIRTTKRIFHDTGTIQILKASMRREDM